MAVGAAIQGSILSGQGGEAVKDVMLLDVTPLSLGTEADGGLMSVLIKRGTTIPTESSHNYHTVEDNQRTMTIVSDHCDQLRLDAHDISLMTYPNYIC